MDLDLAKPFAKLFLLLGRDILIPEEDHAAFSDQQAQLILLLVRQVFQLQSHDLRANVSGQVNDLFCCRQECLLFWVRAGAWVHMGPVMIADLVDVV